MSTKEFIVLLDNGHGYDTPGKRSPDGKFREYKYNREIVDEIDLHLTSYKMIVKKVCKEDYDVSLRERVRRVNWYCSKYGKENVILVSVHCNASANFGWNDGRGWSVYTSVGQTAGDKLADKIHEAAVEALDRWEYPQTFDSYDKKHNQKPYRADWRDGDPDFEDNFAVVKKTNCAACLTENLFQDNKKDVAYLTSIQGKQAIVEAHVNGIMAYYKDWIDDKL